MKPSECAANNGDIKIKKAGGTERKQKVSLEILTGLSKLPYSSEFTQQDGRKKRTTKRLCVTNVTGLLLACFVVIFTKHFMFSGLLQKDQLKESEVWRKVISKQNYCHACLTRFAVFLPLPSCRVSSLLSETDGNVMLILWAMSRAGLVL